MNRLCPTTISCALFPGEVDSPVLNISAEAPDQLLFIGTGYTPFDPFRPPPLGEPRLYIARDCQGESFSVLSQEIADLIAQITAESCQQDNGTGLQFSNSPQTATCFCADGTSFSYTVEAGMFISPMFPTDADGAAITSWIAAADARALAYAEQQASAQKVCITTPGNPHGGVRASLAATRAWCCLNADLTLASEDFYAVSGEGSEPFNFSIISGSLPPGLLFGQTGPRTASITGIATTAGIYTYTVQAVRANLPTISAQITDTFYVLAITNTTLPDGAMGAAYSEQLLTAGTVTPVTFALAAGASLPAGLSLDSTGIISGTPTTKETKTFAVTFTDALGGVCTQDVTINITSSCPDWNNFLWGAQFSSHTGAGFGSFAPDSSAGSAFACFSDSPDNATDSSTNQNTGSISYNGPGCNFNLHIDSARIGDTAHATGFFLIQIGVFSQTVTFPPQGVGSADFPFSIPNTGGIPITIQLTVETRTQIGIGGHQRMEISGFFTNI